LVEVKVCFVVFVFSAAESVKSRKVLSLIHICGFIVALVQAKLSHGSPFLCHWSSHLWASRSLSIAIVAVAIPFPTVAAVVMMVSNIPVAFWLCSLFLLQLATGASISSPHYAVIVDVGSTGSRAYVYEHTPRSDPSEVPREINEVFNHKVKPGFSTLTVGEVEPYIEELVTSAAENVPEELISTTPIYFLATGGMRIIPEQTATDLMAAADEVLSDTSLNPFVYKSHNARVLSGEEEAGFAWIAVNYLRGYFTEEDVPQVGIIEMGGASAQIAFVPEGSPMANLFPVKLNGIDYSLYAHSYLSYGGEYARQWMTEYQLDNFLLKRRRMMDPCLPRGFNETFHLEEVQRDVKVFGSSNGRKCLELARKLVYDVDDLYCHPKPCAIGPFYQPSLPHDMPFYAVGAFYHTAADIDALFPGVFAIDGHMRPATLLEHAMSFCNLNYRQLLRRFARSEGAGSPDYATTRCRRAIYFSDLMTEGYGFPGETDLITVTQDVDGKEYNWAIGALIYE